MIQEICKDEKFLAQKAEQATPDDIQTATDLLETLEAHKDGCVGDVYKRQEKHCASISSGR